MFGFFFNENPVANFEEAAKSRNDIFNQFFWGMINQGIYLAPSPFEAGFVSFSHSEEDINKTIKAAEIVFANLSETLNEN